MERALRWDGLIPQVVGDGDARQATLDEVAGVRALVGDRPYDIVIEGVGSEHSPAAWHDAGASWWIESMWDAMREDSAGDRRARPSAGGSPDNLTPVPCSR